MKKIVTKELNDYQKILIGNVTPTFSQVVFRINAGYEWGPGWTKPHIEFDNEILSIFEKDGWTIIQSPKGSGTSLQVKKYGQYLYLHPQEFTGYMLSDNIEQLSALLSLGINFKMEEVIIEENVYSLSDLDFARLFEKNIEEIDKWILRLFEKEEYIDQLDNLYEKILFPRIMGTSATQIRYKTYSFSDIEFILLNQELNVLVRLNKIKKIGEKYLTVK